MYNTNFTEKEFCDTMIEEENPHQTILDFFCCSQPRETKKFLNYWFDGLYSKKKWIQYSPGEMLYLYEDLIELLESCWIIKELGFKERTAILDSKIFENGVEWMDADLFCVDYERDKAWNNFPRSLSKREFINPYIVLKKVFKCSDLAEWKERLNLILHASLSGNMFLMDANINILKIKDLLEKLIDATYLIYARALAGEKEEAME